MKQKTNFSIKNFIITYKFHVIIWVIGLLFLGYLIYQKVTTPTPLLNGIFLEGEKGKSAAETLSTDFAKSLNYEDTVYKVKFDTEYSYIPGDDKNAENNYKATEHIVSQIEAKQLDFVAGPSTSMTDIAYNSIFIELSSFLNAEQYKLVTPYLLYIDATVVEELEQAFEEKKDTSGITLPDPQKPEYMKEPLAVMIDMSSCKEFTEIYPEVNDTLTLGLIADAPNKDILIKFIDYLLKK